MGSSSSSTSSTGGRQSNSVGAAAALGNMDAMQKIDFLADRVMKQEESLQKQRLVFEQSNEKQNKMLRSMAEMI
eukprot:Awhi_evm1s12774